MTTLDCIIVGAGQAGLGVSYFLYRDGFEHIIYEKGRIAESWLSQRWDSFRLNTPNFMNVLPGFTSDSGIPDAFPRSDELVSYFQRYVEKVRLPVHSGVSVVSVALAEDGGLFLVKTTTSSREEKSVLSRSVVIACGSQNIPKIPPVFSRFPANITQLHTSSYRSSSSLPSGGVVVVGSGQTGCQITEELLSAGRKVYLCTIKVGRAPRHYRGRDI